ncbi:O-antigen polymerase [Microbacterium kunmingense]|uniref:O-antigen polymerase n=1 Tax=Microbacterium kunmingense TaxID=2915939 RepID=UPI003D76512B
MTLAPERARFQAAKVEPKSPLLATFFFLAAVAIPITFLAVPTELQQGDTGLLAVSSIILVVAAARLAGIIFSRSRHILVTVLWMYVYITSGVVPLAQLSTGLFPFLFAPDQLVQASLLLLAAVVAYEGGRFFNRAVDSRPAPEVARIVSVGRLKWLTLIGIAGAALYVRQVGGVGVLLSSRYELNVSLMESGLRSADSNVGSAFITNFGTVPIFIAMTLWLLHILRHRVKTPAAWIWFLVLFAVNLLVNNPVTTARYWLLTMGIAFIFALPKFSVRRLQGMIIGGLLFALIVFSYLDYFRNEADTRQLILRSVPEQLATKDYDQLIMTANGLGWVEMAGHTVGQQFLSAMLFFVPRSMWPNKARDTGVEIGTALGAPNVNLSAPLPIELYVDFALPGVIIGFLLIGYFSRLLDWKFDKTRDALRSHTYVIDLLIPLIAGYSFILMRGSLLQSMGRLAVMLAVLLFVVGPKVRVGPTAALGEQVGVENRKNL